MIILVTEEFEITTCEVMEWVDYLGEEVIRLPGSLFFREGAFKSTLRFTNDDEDLYLEIRGRKIMLSDIKSIWFRRDESGSRPSFLKYIKDEKLKSELVKHSFYELKKAKEFVIRQLMGRPYIGNPFRKSFDKFEGLRKARESGLDIPATLLTDSKADLIQFKKEYGSVITKAISDSDFFSTEDGKDICCYTNEIEDEVLEGMSDEFMQTFVQETLDKELEIRTFYLFGKCYSMAIFSQLDEQTSVDFRRYNIVTPNRNVPYQLPKELERRIHNFMESVGLSTGSLDFVKTKCKRIVFLEVNPVGQFGMTSKPCNYNLEKIVADYLCSN